MAGSNGGVASAVGGRCEHARAALAGINDKTAEDATRVQIDGDQSFDGVKKLVSTANAKGLLTHEDFYDVMAIVEGAEESEVWPLYETAHHHYLVYDNLSRATGHNWAAVKYDEHFSGSALRGVTDGRAIMCRVRVRKDWRLVGVKENSDTDQHRRSVVYEEGKTKSFPAWHDM